MSLQWFNRKETKKKKRKKLKLIGVQRAMEKNVYEKYAFNQFANDSGNEIKDFERKQNTTETKYHNNFIQED